MKKQSALLGDLVQLQKMHIHLYQIQLKTQMRAQTSSPSQMKAQGVRSSTQPQGTRSPTKPQGTRSSNQDN